MHKRGIPAVGWCLHVCLSLRHTPTETTLHHVVYHADFDCCYNRTSVCIETA